MFIFFPSRFQCLWFGKKRKTDRYVQNHWRSRFFFSIFFLLQNTSCKNIRNNYRSEEKTIFSLPEKTIRPRKSLPLLSGFPAHVLYNRHRTTSNNDIFACYLLAVSFTGKKKKREREKKPIDTMLIYIVIPQKISDDVRYTDTRTRYMYHQNRRRSLVANYNIFFY